MTSKEQEFQTLEKIKKLVADLGEDSYIGFAFEGCFEVAEENIRNDFACSMKQRAETAEAKAVKAESGAHDCAEALKTVRDRMAEMLNEIEAYKRQAVTAEARAYKAKLELEDLREQLEANKQQETTDTKDLEILKLKAKLYDMMSA